MAKALIWERRLAVGRRVVCLERADQRIFLSRATAIFATIFFLTSLGLSFIQFDATRSVGVMSGATITAPVDAEAETVEQSSDSKVNEIPK